MEITGQLTKYVGILIIVIVAILIIIYLLNQLTGGNIVKSIVCGALYLIGPFGSVFSALTQACIAVPA